MPTADTTISIDIPGDQLSRIQDAVCRAAGLDSSIENIKAALIAHIQATVVNVERSAAEAAAREAVVEPPAVSLS